MWKKQTWNKTTSCLHVSVHHKRSRAALSRGTLVPRCSAIVRKRTGREVRVWVRAWKTTCALELGRVVLQGTEATGHKCCCYSCFLWSFSPLRVAFLLSQGEIRHRRLEPGSHCSLVSPKERIYPFPFPNPKQEVLATPKRKSRSTKYSAIVKRNCCRC